MSFCDPLSSARRTWKEPNVRDMVLILMYFETIPLPLGASKTLYIEGFPWHSSRREVR